MRNLLAAASVFAFVVASAHSSLAGPADQQVVDWTGWYAGLNAGGNLGGDPISTTATNSDYCPPGSCGKALDFANASIAGASGEFPVVTNGFVGGAQLGFNWQAGDNLVTGLEADLQGLAGAGGSFSRSSTDDISGFANHSVATDLTVSKSIDFLGTVRGRVGLLVTPSLLLFGTGGFAYGQANMSTSISQSLVGLGLGSLGPSFSSNTSVSRILGGWTIGGGGEFMFAPNWSLKVEGLHYDLGNLSSTGQLVDAIVTGVPQPNYFVNDVQSTSAFKGTVVRVGLNAHF